MAAGPVSGDVDFVKTHVIWAATGAAAFAITGCATLQPARTASERECAVVMAIATDLARSGEMRVSLVARSLDSLRAPPFVEGPRSVRHVDLTSCIGRHQPTPGLIWTRDGPSDRRGWPEVFALSVPYFPDASEARVVVSAGRFAGRVLHLTHTPEGWAPTTEVDGWVVTD